MVLLAGEPGVGKSTLLLAVGARAAREGRRVLVVTGEETAAQVQSRAARIEALEESLFLAAETDLAALVTHVEQVEPSLLIVDSVQTIAAPDVDGAAGGVTQVRAVASALVAVAKSRGMATLLVGHVTKDGNVAGPRTLEHLVDVVLSVEGERATPLRMVRAIKNRFGPTDEVGCFRLDADGLTDLPDPSGLFLSRAHGLPGLESVAPPGTCVTVTLEGRRPLVVEVQALVAPPAGSPSPAGCLGTGTVAAGDGAGGHRDPARHQAGPARRLRLDDRRGPDQRAFGRSGARAGRLQRLPQPVAAG